MIERVKASKNKSGCIILKSDLLNLGQKTLKQKKKFKNTNSKKKRKKNCGVIYNDKG